MEMKQTPKISPRKPSPQGKPSPQQAKAFVAEGKATKESTTSPKREGSGPSRTTGAPLPGKFRERRRTEEVVAQMTVYLPPDLEKQLRVEAVTRDVRPSDLIVEALRAFFGAK